MYVGGVSGVVVVVQASVASQTQFQWSVSKRQALAYSVLPDCQAVSIVRGYQDVGLRQPKSARGHVE